MLKEYIGKKMIEDGLMSRVIIPKLEDDGLKAYIGEYWFYFGGMEFQETEPSNIPFCVVVEELKSVLDDFYKLPEFEAEYLYYYHYLLENI